MNFVATILKRISAWNTQALKYYFYIVTLCFADYVLRNCFGGMNFFVFRGGILGLGLVSFLIFLCSLFFCRLLLFRILALIFTVAFTVDLFCFYHFGSVLSPSMIFTAMETNLSETTAFAKMYLDWQTILILLGVLLFCIAYFWIFGNLAKTRFRTIFLCLALLGAIQAVSEVRWIKPGRSFIERHSVAFVYPLWQYCALLYSMNQMKKASEYFKNYKSQMYKKIERISLKKSNGIEKIVVVLGESSQRGHMQIYGYSRATNPLLSQFPNKNLFIFDNVVSPHAQTTLSVRKIFTFSHYENEKENPWYQQTNLIPFIQKSGYNTLWISNQQQIAVNGNSVGEIANLSQKSIFVSDNSKGFDERVLAPLQKEFDQQQRQFFVIHLMGAHGWYGDRYPNNFTKFNVLNADKKSRAIALYDNAILYNDYVLNEIFKRFSSSDSIVIYISDHGEEIYEGGEFAGHVDARINRFMVEIPMIIYVSDIFIQKHPKIYEKLKNSIHRPYMSDDLIHTILDIAGIESEEFDPTRSIINDKFNDKRKRIVGGGDGIDYDKELKSQKANYH